MIVHIAIGNSDDKLTQRQWSRFYEFVDIDVRRYGKVLIGAWSSLPNAPYQNAAWCIEIDAAPDIERLKHSLSELAGYYRQDSIAWTPGETEYITSQETPA